MARPRSRYWVRCCVRTKRRMRARALPVTTKRSQVGDGVCAFEVTISTWSPFCSWVRSGSSRPLILAPTQVSPICGMHRIGEIDRGGAARQRDQIALRGEGEDLVLEHLELGVLEEFLRARGLLEDFEQLAQPAILPPVDPGRSAACRSSAPRRRARRPRACRGCGSAPRCAAAPGRSRRCAASGNCSASGSRCSP